MLLAEARRQGRRLRPRPPQRGADGAGGRSARRGRPRPRRSRPRSRKRSRCPREAGSGPQRALRLRGATEARAGGEGSAQRQYASKDQMAEIDQEIAGSQDRLKATDLKLQYLQQMIAVAEGERRVAEAHVVTTQSLTEQAKYRAMKAGSAPEAGSVNAGDIDHRVAA